MIRTMETRNEGYMVPYEATAPAEILESELEYRGIPLEDFCIDAKIDLEFLKELIKGEHPVTPELAQKFEDLVGIPARIWLNMQKDYENEKLVIAERKKQKEQEKAQKPNVFKRMSKSVAAAML